MLQLIGTLAVFASVLVLAYQARELTRQSRAANQVAATRAHQGLFRQFEWVSGAFLQHPELRAYFFSEMAPPPNTTDLSSRLETIAERYADVLYVGLDTASGLVTYGEWRPSKGRQDFASQWVEYVTAMIERSEPLRSVIRANPGVWPSLELLLADHDAAHKRGADTSVAPPGTPDVDQR
jgi:hypothetical protein